MSTIEQALRKRYPLPGDDEFVRVGLSDDYYLGMQFTDLEEYPDQEKYCERLFEVPREWLARWDGIKAAYDEMQEELWKIHTLPHEERWLTPPKDIIQGDVIYAEEG